MSDTDDTDDLLLIPPDEHTLNPDTEVLESLAHGAYFRVVDSLIGQVNKLNLRVHSIETDAETSMNTEMESTNRYKSSDDIMIDGYYNHSTFSTPQKPRMRYRTHSQSPQKPRGCFTATRAKVSPRKDQQQLDTYRVNNGLAHKKEGADIIEVNGRIINLAEIENMLEEIEGQKRQNDLRLKEQEATLHKSKAWRVGDNTNSLPPSLMDNTQSFLNEKASEVCNDFPKITVATLSVSKAGPCESSKSSSTSCTTACTQITTRHTSNKSLNDPPFDLSDDMCDLDSGKSRRLLSLNGLWGDSDHVGSINGRLEEEKLRRQHCEDIIQELQTKSLELQERLAVAVEVDRAKDNALQKFHDTWERMTSRLKAVVEENCKLEGTVRDLQIQHETTMQECSQKMQQYKQEATHALNLAQGSQEKLTTYMGTNTELQMKLESLERKILEIEQSHETEKTKCQRLNDIIVQKELDLTESKSVLSNSRQEVETSKKAIELCQVEFTNLKEQCLSLEESLTEKHKTIKELEAKLKEFDADNTNLKLLYADSKNELDSYKHKMDKTKSELRDFYQQQVELLVQDKLKEFQLQLDKAETSLQEEIHKRELSLAKTAATHIQQITEKHNLEIKLLEEKQKEEMKFYQMQLQQAQQQINAQQSKMKHYSERRAVLAQQLHKVMEVQWMEALKIINNTKSPYNGTPMDTTLDQLRSLKLQSQNNLEEVLSDPEQIIDANDRNNYLLTETPVSSKNSGPKMARDGRDNSSELQKYVNMLLSKQPPQTQNEPMKDSTQNTDLKSEAVEDKTKYGDRRHMKPPWK